MYFILSSFICQDSSFTLPQPQFLCRHLLAAGIRGPSSIGIGYDSPIKVLPSTQYWKILGYTQYPNANIILTITKSQKLTLCSNK